MGPWRAMATPFMAEVLYLYAFCIVIPLLLSMYVFKNEFLVRDRHPLTGVRQMRNVVPQTRRGFFPLRKVRFCRPQSPRGFLFPQRSRVSSPRSPQVFFFLRKVRFRLPQYRMGFSFLKRKAHFYDHMGRQLTNKCTYTIIWVDNSHKNTLI